jgi:hypothetical protein
VTAPNGNPTLFVLQSRAYAFLSVSHVVVLGGLKVRDGGEFDRLVRDAALRVSPKDSVKITLDVAKAADGTAIHQMLGPMGENDPELARQFGKVSLFVAARDDAVLYKHAALGLFPAAGLLTGRAGRQAPAGLGIIITSRARDPGELHNAVAISGNGPLP